ncbi:MAG: phosphoribosylformylglycinamidine synthase subunit PurL [Candidatus Eisenbacteria bacterium]|uniref:Phosphoribosylformylglycinamidine synthase subunit PurL n=1 Tax=Eiseniibacteriota bacterium TaxID=2212470 RepID=A0A849SK30_UNCEI|nr:phosphoribosylformylglycinamidine synthase subunit PurL [Candidatus Eisenbacteria bacterium]
MSSAALDTFAYSLEEARDPAAVARRLARRGVTLEPDEVALLVELLGRPPRWAEVVLFGILWSEHCSYKSTRHLLKQLPTAAPTVILGPGEDAGVVALPPPCDDLALVLAHESHNHPSQVLPVEGAATGVGGIVRDVGCMGAEVIGVLDSLRFGEPDADGVAARDIVRGVVRGIADYGNALGVPNLGGDVVFDSRFAANCLVNVMAVGLVPRDGILRSRVPEGPGPWVFVLVGKPTDESGFGGASFASGELGEGDQRGAVQLPDPFLKRVLHVANAEMFRRIRSRGIEVGFKDLGAGGVACATSELAAAGGRGAEVRLDSVHRVDRPIPPEVLLCAETQERFCWVLPAAFADEACTLYNTEYALDDVYPGAGARVIGEVRDEPSFRVTWHGEALVDCPVDAITTGRRVVRPAQRRVPASRLAAEPSELGARGALLALLGSWNGASREYLFRHYDSEVQGRTWMRPGEGDATVARVHPERPTGVAFAVAGNPHWCAADPDLGARHAVAEAARNLACVGARPLALTDCLNFGHPSDERVMGDLEATIDGLRVAAEALGELSAPGYPLPYVSGNVSLHNQSGADAIPPSPIVMAAGVIRDVTTALGQALQEPGNFLVLAGQRRTTVTGTQYARTVMGAADTAPPPLDLAHEARLQALAVAVAEDRLAVAAHDVSDGGLGTTLAEMLLARAVETPLGIEVDLGALECEGAIALFSEEPAIVWEVSPAALPRFMAAAREARVVAWPIGTVADHSELRVLCAAEDSITWRRDELATAVESPLPRLWNEDLS